jgi:16S rRNA (adenine1518-N6/adenine1519-N6)-dimethyltransferase
MRRPRLSQHFLRDRHIVETILQAADLQASDTVLEIGPGRGALTDALARRAQRLVAVELDRALAETLRIRFAANPSVQIIQADFLKIDLDQLFLTGGIKILGNLPYAVTSPILEKILPWPFWCTAVFLVQREVGERLRSAPSSKTYGVLSLAVQLFAEVEKVALVKPGAFSPPPKVTSLVVRLHRKEKLPVPVEAIPDFFDLVHAAFTHRRKTLSNSLSLFAEIPKAAVENWLAAECFDGTRRAENLTLEEYAELARKWAIFRREKKFDNPPANVYNTSRS